MSVITDIILLCDDEDLAPEALLDIGLKLVQAALCNTGASRAENSKLLDEKIRALFV